MSVPPPVPLNERLRFVVLSMALLAVLILAVYASVFDAADAHKTRPPFGQEDALMGARCEARCWTNKTPCVKLCLQKALTKPGLCPKRETLLSPFDAVCLTTCSQDSQCPGLAKCCRHSCGVTCQDPDHLSSATGIPEVPRNVRVTETVKKRSILIEWSSDEEPPSGSVIYVIEERHHAGRNFIEEHLSEWTPCARTNASGYTLKNLVKPGRWYQFRVAAVNENGTKGFSKTSPTFGASSRPKPPKAPQNVTVSALWSDANGTLFGEIRWLPPHSDLPIQRYKIFWSRRLHGAKALDSVLVHQQVVSKDRTRFLLEDLQPNSLYFLQIQALVQFGKNRLKGQKSGLVLNTTNYTNVTVFRTGLSLKSVLKSKVEGLHLQKLYWSRRGLKGRISWRPQKDNATYTINLWTGPCYGSSKSQNKFKLAATSRVAHFDLSDLHFDCQYKVAVRKVADQGGSEDTLTFFTPNCDDFKRKNRKTRCIK
ncbi:unnamed protein product [Tenebrio molitor]|jgi:hypothetical protein|nr:unnamed protein product [Tenebrio molitor]